MDISKLWRFAIVGATITAWNRSCTPVRVMLGELFVEADNA
jgi:hypothetical protein